MQGREGLVKHQLALFVATGGAFCVFAWLQFATDSLVGTDAYYHLKLAALMAKSNITLWPIEFRWLPKTVLNPKGFTDHHFLFHVFLIPFIRTSILLGGKYAAITCGMLTFLAFQFLLPRVSLFQRSLLSIGFFAISPGFLYRMSMVRAQSLSLVMLMLLVMALSAKNTKICFLLGAVYVWLYNAFPLAIVLLVCSVLADYLCHRRVAIAPIISLLTGLLLGVIVNPYFPRNIFFLYHHLIDKFHLGDFATKVGKEWYPYDSEAFFIHLGGAMLCFVFSVYLAARNQSKLTHKSTLLILFTTVLLLMALRSRRFVELFPVFSLATLAFVAYESQVLAAISSKRCATIPECLGKIVQSGVVISVALLICYHSLSITRADIESAKPYATYKSSAEWLRTHSEANSLVFTTDWDDFPRLFHFNDNNTYLVGLDPYFLYAQDRTGFQLWRELTQGRLDVQAGSLIASRFGAQYIFVDKQHATFRRQLDSDPSVKRVFRANDSSVYEIVRKQVREKG